MGNKPKFYVVRTGEHRGIYPSWKAVKPFFNGKKGCRSFTNPDDAIQYLTTGTCPAHTINASLTTQINHLKPAQGILIVDGSYQPRANVVSGAYILYTATGKYIGYTAYDNPEWLPFRNFTGELFSTIRGLKDAVGRKVEQLTIYYDYEGIHAYIRPEHPWKSRNVVSDRYIAEMGQLQKQIRLRFQKVPGHAGIIDHDECDRATRVAPNHPECQWNVV